MGKLASGVQSTAYDVAKGGSGARAVVKMDSKTMSL